MIRSAGVLSLLALTLFVAVLRPITHWDGPAGFRRLTLLSEAAPEDGPALPAPAVLDSRPIDLPRADASPRFVQALNLALPVVVRLHLKLPPRRAADSPPAH